MYETWHPVAMAIGYIVVVHQMLCISGNSKAQPNVLCHAGCFVQA